MYIHISAILYHRPLGRGLNWSGNSAAIFLFSSEIRKHVALLVVLLLLLLLLVVVVVVVVLISSLLLSS